MEKQSLLERVFESGLWNVRFIVLFAVIFSSIACVVLFLLGSYEIVHVIYDCVFGEAGICGDVNVDCNIKGIHTNLLLNFIEAIDLYLIGIVLLIFSFGIYELFISKIDIAREDEAITILEIKDLDELKNKIIKVIIMVLIVSFFSNVLTHKDTYDEPLEMLYFALSILALALGVYLIKIKH